MAVRRFMFVLLLFCVFCQCPNLGHRPDVSGGEWPRGFAVTSCDVETLQCLCFAADDGEESGWKLLHGDVFRYPPHLPLFCACVGTGCQLLVLSVAVFCLGLVGTFYPHNRGAIYTALILLYAATAVVAGYVSSGYYREMGGRSWARTLLLACFVYCGPLFLTFAFNNTLAIIYEVWGIRSFVSLTQASCARRLDCSPPIH